MIVGNLSVLAIESNIQTAFESPGLRGLGHFVLHIGGAIFGVREPNATMLANSYDTILRGIAHRGRHLTPFSEQIAKEVALAFYDATYSDEPQESYFDVTKKEFVSILSSAQVQWAPDGDQAFDDGSFVLQFDVKEHVRLIAFRTADHGVEVESLRDVWLPAEEFYGTLEDWAEDFLEQWNEMPRIKAN